MTYHTPMALFCPICKRPVESPAGDVSTPSSRYFPFCSDRCKLIDLGRWLDGKYQVPVVEGEGEGEGEGTEGPRDEGTE